MACKCSHEPVHHSYGTDRCHYPGCKLCFKYEEKPMAMIETPSQKPEAEEPAKMVLPNATEEA